ncbi:MAG: type II toxin-antitoxin system VapC family toxin [Mycobacteriales bacterium]
MFIDTSVIMYAGGAEHPHRASCQRVLERVADRSLEAVTSTEVVQEILRRFARGQRETGQRMARSVLDLFDDLLPVDRQSVGEAVSLFARHPQLSARDALHIGDIVSVDTGFDLVTAVQRVEPAALS